MDADDYIEKNMYKIMIAQMESDSTLDVGVCLWNFIDQNGKKVVNKENISFSAYGKQTGRDFLKHIYDDSYTNGIVVSPWNKIFKRECIVKHKMVGRYAEDDYLMSKVFSNDDCRIVVIKEIIYVFLTIFLYLLKCPQSLILSALRAFCFCGKPHISRSIFLYFLYQTWLKSW